METHRRENTMTPDQSAHTLAYLEQSSLFAGLSSESLEHLLERVNLVRFGEGEVVFHEDDAADCMYVIGAGRVAISKKMGQGERLMMHLGEGEHFGEMALISSSRRTATIRALTEVECVKLGEREFQALVAEDPYFAQRMLRVLSARMKHSDDTAILDMLRAHQALSFSLAKLADSRDPDTGGHLYRVREYCLRLAELLSEHPKFASVITEAFKEDIYLVSPLHDIGKVAIPDGVLMKQGKLTEAEYEIMAEHTTLGAEAIDTVLQYCDFKMFQMARRIILCHHERYDGSGYPRGLKGEDIPIEARIMALADNYDALLSHRVYKAAMEYDEARELIREGSGTLFDPDMAAVMLDNISDFEKIHRHFGDEGNYSW